MQNILEYRWQVQYSPLQKMIQFGTQKKILRALCQVEECYTNKFCKEEETVYFRFSCTFLTQKNEKYTLSKDDTDYPCKRLKEKVHFHLGTSLIFHVMFAEMIMKNTVKRLKNISFQSFPI